MNLYRKVLILCVIIGGSCLAFLSLAADAPPQQDKAGAAALDKNAVCTRCHNDKSILAIQQTKHGVKGDSHTPACQSCHGKSEKHIKAETGESVKNVKNVKHQEKNEAPDVVFKKGVYVPSRAKVQNTACLSCHEQNSKRTYWNGSAHHIGDVACASCHKIHAANDMVREKKTQATVCFTCHKEQRADSRKISHHPISEGKVVCSNCHNPHGSAGPKLLKKNTVNETCFTCHAEKRGPFLWEHQPVTEDCSNCHNPHGSNITPLLKSRSPFLCSECHDGPHHSKDPAGRNAAGYQGGLTTVPSENYTSRGCLNCHSMVHGSNHPAGAILQR